MRQRRHPEPGNCIRCWGMGSLKWEVRRGDDGGSLWIAIPAREGQTCPVCAGTGKQARAQATLSLDQGEA